MINWYAAYCRYGSESHAEERLNWQGFETYLPMFKKKFIGVKRAYYEPRPLFPTYVFVRFDIDRNGWRDILSTGGVRGLVANGHGELPVALPERAVIQLKAREHGGYVTFENKPKFHNGQWVKITDGPFLDNLAQVAYLDDQERVAVLLNLFGRATVAHLLSCHLEPADNQMTVNSGRSPQRIST